jgi:hypothetical protein
MRPFTMPCLMLAAAALAAQAQDLHAVPLPGSRKDDLALPLIASTANPAAAARLNAYLQLVYLEGLAKPGMKDPFAHVRYDFHREDGAAVTGSTSALSWKAANQGRLLAIQITSETMGAYPTEAVDDLLLDGIHGQPVTASDLFTVEGLKALRTRLAGMRKAKLRQVIQSEKQGKPGEDAQACLEAQEESLKEQAFDGIQDLRLDAKTLAFPASLDLPHAMMVCDVDLTLSLPRQELAPYLSAYGEALLDPSLPAPALPAAWAHRVFMGQIGTAQVALHLLREQDGSIGGSYAYLKRGAAIDLSGKAEDGAYALDESDADGNTTGHLAFRQEGLQLKGEWTSPDGKRSLPFTASPE